MKKICLLLTVLLVLSLSGMVMSAEKITSLPREETLYFAGLQWGPVTSYNVLAGNPGWPLTRDQNVNILYETLFGFNLLNGEMEPQLATEYNWVDDLTLEVILDSHAHFQNGTPFTAADVVYTYELGKEYSTSFSALWKYLNEVKAVDDNTIRFVLKKDNPNRLILLHNLANVYIVSKEIYSAKEEEVNHDEVELRQWTDLNPVGTGPYTVYKLSDERIVFKRDDNYWGQYKWGLPAPKYLVHPIFKSNDAGNRALEQGNIDISQQFIPRVWEMSLVKGLPIHTWYEDTPYHVPGSIPSMFINHTRKPLDDVNFRRALAYAINYEKVPPLAMSRYSEVVKSSLVLPQEEKYFSQEDVDKYGWKYDPAKAEEILQEAGYKKGSDGYYRNPDGSKISLKLECPYGWTDWMVTLKIAAQSAQKIGLDIRTEFPEFAPLFDRMQNGDFDLTMWQPAGYGSPAQPWDRFRWAMDSSDVGPVGELAFTNFGRYSNQEADKLIKEIPLMSNEEEMIAGIRKLDRIFMEDVPVIPLVYRPWRFYTYNETHWTGFPNAKNPYAPPQDAAIGAGIRVLFNIKPVDK